jgi:hypothetical protein
VFCNNCTNNYRSIPSLNSKHPVRVCRDCYRKTDDNNNNTAAPMPIQSGCREANGTPNGSFNSAGGQKVKG